MKTKIIAGVVVVSLATLVWGIAQYLGPDDIAGCEKPTPGTCAPADAIVVVSGGDTNARVAEGVALYKAGWAPRMIFSGAAADQTGLSNALAMKKVAIAMGVSETVISTEEYSLNTAQNARNTARMLSLADARRIILVTSAYHQRRASLEFRRQVAETVMILNHPVHEDRQWNSLWWMTPGGWWLAGGELVKIGLHYAAPEAGL